MTMNAATDDLMSTDNENKDTRADGEGGDSAVRSPGAMVRTARERAHLSLDELAAQTKLARHTLDALERDDFNALLEPVYVRGYYRKCAKVLAIPEAELIDAYQNRVAPRGPAAPSKLRLASGTELGSASRLPVAMGIVLAIVAIVVCAFLWFARSRSEPPPPAVAPAAETPAEVVPEVPAADDEASPEGMVPGAAPEGDAPTDAALPELVPAAPAAAAPASVQTPPAPRPEAAGGSGTLSLSFSAASWVRVDDASGKTLLNGLMRTGDQQTIKGALPFNVFLGNAPGVTVEFDGKPVDVAAHTRDNQTARFPLPPQ